MAGPIPPPLPLAHRPTPLESMERLGAHLGFGPGRLWVKRDDLTALGAGGNKARKLEYLCAEALALGCDTLVTGGGPQSNHVRMTAAAANRLGLGCVAVVAGDPDEAHGGNLVLDRLLGVEIEWTGEFDYYPLEAAIEDAAGRQAERGRRPYRIPIGGASVVGAMAYADAAEELRRDRPDLDLVVVADGSGGTHAGLAAGLGDHARVLGVDVGARPDLDGWVPARAAEVARAAGRPEPAGAVQVDHDHAGPAYGIPTDEGREAARLAARLEGLFLDPVYTAKAMAALVSARRHGRVEPDTVVVFLHTGGLPALFSPAYADWVADA